MRRYLERGRLALPGLLLCGAVTAAAYVLERLETRILGRAWLESLVLAILLGCILRSLWRIDGRYQHGIQLGAKLLLEIAVVLLGASISTASLLQHGAALLGGIALVVLLAILISYGIGRGTGLPHNMALLIACGNSICGNSAIAAVAPVIDADGTEVATAIAFTAVLGVAVVLSLPLAVPLLSLSAVQYGVFAGLTVYAVPQVLAATCAVSATSAQIGTVVKLVRVLMLGPVVLVLSLLGRRGGRTGGKLGQMLPWFIAGFLLMLGLRSLHWIPQAMLAAAHAASNMLTMMSMAALGLGVDARAVTRAGGRVVAVVLASLLGLALVSYMLIRLLQV